MLLESLETLNERLLNEYGRWEGFPRWRVVWSEDQYEKRLTEYTREGFKLLTPMMVELPKYKQWIHNRYILERIIPVPWMNSHELTTKMSYEPLWVFQTPDGKTALPPKWEAIQLIVATVHKQMEKAGLGTAKYKDPSPDGDKEAKELRIQKLQEELFGNETETGDAMAHGQAIIVPRNYENGN